jgi:uncharacterized membrane protein
MEARSLSAGQRIQSIDILRGAVIVLMALDHVRDYFHAGAYQFDALDPSRTTLLLYATRWITHFCAPTFVLLAGVSAWLQLAKGKSRGELSRFLLTRGLWLVVLELTVIQVGWAFTFGMPFLQVIWAIGWSMVALAALVWLPRIAVLAIGVAIVAGHNLLGGVPPQQLGPLADVWPVLYQGGLMFRDGQPFGLAAYPILPWFGVMALGYGLGGVFTAPAGARDRTFLLLGAGMIAAFVALRWLNGYGDLRPWAEQATLGQTVMAFLNVAKYPPSLMFVCATLGPVFLLLPLIERWRGPVAAFFMTFGAVPLFAYVLHLYVLHGLQVLAALATGRDPSFTIDFIGNMVFRPDVLQGTGYSLPVAYAAWLAVLAILYPLCLWWGAVKRGRRAWWLSYV